MLHMATKHSQPRRCEYEVSSYKLKSRLHLGCISAASRLSLGLYLGCISAACGAAGEAGATGKLLVTCSL